MGAIIMGGLDVTSVAEGMYSPIRCMQLAANIPSPPCSCNALAKQNQNKHEANEGNPGAAGNMRSDPTSFNMSQSLNSLPTTPKIKAISTPPSPPLPPKFFVSFFSQNWPTWKRKWPGDFPPMRS